MILEGENDHGESEASATSREETDDDEKYQIEDGEDINVLNNNRAARIDADRAETINRREGGGEIEIINRREDIEEGPGGELPDDN